MTFDEFRLAYLDDLNLPLGYKRKEFDVYGYRPAEVLKFLNDLNEIRFQAINILVTRATVPLFGMSRMSTKRCHKVERSKHLWQLTTDGGARFLYFQDGQTRLIVVSATLKMKENKFHAEIDRADIRRIEYLELKERKIK